MIRSKLGKIIRNFLNIRPSPFLFDYRSKGKSISDAFFWRVDDEFVTYFRYSDLLKIFYNNKSSNIKIIFYDSNFNLVKEYNISSFDSYNELIIDQRFLNIKKGFGSFYIFHETENKLETLVRNSCYTGYSYRLSIPSFVHGNLYAASKDFNKNKIEFGLGAKNFKKKHIYQVQNFMKFNKTEIVIINNCNSTVKVELGDFKTNIKKGNTIIINTKKNDLVSIKSNALLLRPIIFNYDDKFFDVYHG